MHQRHQQEIAVQSAVYFHQLSVADCTTDKNPASREGGQGGIESYRHNMDAVDDDINEINAEAYNGLAHSSSYSGRLEIETACSLAR